MEVITIESKAFAALVEKIDGIAAYVEESRQREQDGQQGQEEKNSRTTGKWMTGSEVCEYLEISPRTLQRYRTNRIIALLHLREENPLPPHGRGTVPGTVDAGNA